MTIAEAETLSPILPLLLTVAEVALVTNTSSPIRPALVTVAGPPTIVVVVSLDRLIVPLPSLLVVFFVRLLKAWQIGRAHSELQSLMRISYAVFCLKKKIYQLIYHIASSTTQNNIIHSIQHIHIDQQGTHLTHLLKL